MSALAFAEACAMAGVDPVMTEAFVAAQIDVRHGLREPQDLERRWYESVAAGEPDYSVYAAPEYVGEAWLCWALFSRGYIRMLAADGERFGIGEPRVIADLGCGIGLTSYALASVYPQAQVTGTNLMDTPQARVAETYHAQWGGRVTFAEAAGGPVDLAFASEYFEHFAYPLAHLDEVLAALTPRVLVTANSFYALGIGHFPLYRDGDWALDGEDAERAFGLRMALWGYRLASDYPDRGKPHVWVRAQGPVDAPQP